MRGYLVDTVPSTAKHGLADRLKQATHALHRQAETTGFIGDLLAGRATRTGYGVFLRNLLPVYEALESALQRQSAIQGPLQALAQPPLYRSAALRADLEHLLGPDWPSAVPGLDAGAAYVARIEAAAAHGDGATLAGHAYVRYLGDLNGGQILSRLLSRNLRLPPHALQHYAFPALASLRTAALRYRQDIDALANVPGVDLDGIEEEAVASFGCAIALGNAVLSHA